MWKPVLCLCVLLAGCTSSEEQAQKYLEQAQAFYASGDLAKASVEVRNALQINGDLAEARLLYARLLETDQKWRDMRSNLEHAISIDPQLLPAQLKLGMLQVAGQEFDAALATADRILKIDDTSAVAHTLKAATYFYLGDTEASLAAANEALALDAGEVGAISVVTNLLSEAKPLEALSYIDSGLESKTNHGTLLLLRARLLEQSGDLDGAIETFDRLLAAYPDEIFFVQQYIDALAKNERVDLAIDRLSQLAAGDSRTVTRQWLVHLLVQEGRHDEAEALLSEYLAEHPNETVYRLMTADVLVKQGEIDEARRQLLAWEAAAQQESERNRLLSALGNLEYFYGNSEQAPELVSRVLEHEPANEEALLLRARIATTAGRKDDAAADLRTVLRNNPNSAIAKELLAINHQQQGAQGLAVDLYRDLLALEPTNYRALIALGRQALEEQDFANAVQLGEAAVRSYPNDFAASQILLTAHVGQADISRAMAEADRVRSTPGNQGVGHYFKGHIEENLGELNNAVSSYRLALEHRADLVEALSGLVRVLTELNRQAEARATLEEHVEAHPQHSHAVLQLAGLRAAGGEQEAALNLLEDGVRRFPDNEQMSIALVDFLAAIGRPQEARAVAESAKLRHPESPLLLQKLGEVAVVLDQPKLALQHFEASLALEPKPQLRNNIAMLLVDHFPNAENNARALTLVRDFVDSESYALLDTVGWVYRHLGDQRKALDLLERANRLADSQDPSILYHLGVVETELGLRRRGRASLEKALASVQEFPERHAAETLLPRTAL